MKIFRVGDRVRFINNKERVGTIEFIKPKRDAGDKERVYVRLNPNLAHMCLLSEIELEPEENKVSIKLKVAERKELDKLATDFDNAKCALRDRVTEIRDAWQGEYDDKSEKWKEGEAAETALERIDQATEIVDALDGIEDCDLDSLEN